MPTYLSQLNIYNLLLAQYNAWLAAYQVAWSQYQSAMVVYDPGGLSSRLPPSTPPGLERHRPSLIDDVEHLPRHACIVGLRVGAASTLTAMSPGRQPSSLGEACLAFFTTQPGSPGHSRRLRH